MRTALALLCFSTLSALAAPIAVPALTGRVVDEARVFAPAEASRLSERLAALENERNVQMAVLTVPTLGDETIEEFSIRVVEQWKLGQKGQDRGILFVFAPTLRKMRLEVGYGLEGDIPDAVAKRIVADRARPYFVDRRYAEGTEGVIDAVQSRLNGERIAEPIRRSRRNSTGMELLVFLILVGALGMSMLGAGRRSRWNRSGRNHWGGWGGGGWGGGGGGWGGGGSSGGFGGGGGGFGGGGASSDW